ncbi:MAG: hypothetical protein HWE27_18860 [Gammaproteobacteria bacterium]|nr:hypothetical protein [Gammaproteobacteria bacterium]
MRFKTNFDIVCTICHIALTLVCLIPTVLTLLFGLMLSLYLMSSLTGWVAIIGLLVIPSYALFCLVWFSRRTDHMQLTQLPIKIKVGIYLGLIATLTGLVVMLKGGNSISQIFIQSWIFGLGPSIYLMWLILKRRFILENLENEI